MTDKHNLPRTMRAVRVHATGGPEELRVDQVPVPQPGAGDLLVRVEACGVNFIDIYKRSGQYRAELPLVPGEEGAGSVVSCGAGVPHDTTGRRVAWAGVTGSYADYVLVPASRAVEVPESVDTDTAAALMLQGMTAHYLSSSTFALGSGDRCLIHAAAGGVGLLLVQMARMRGAFVIGTAGTDSKRELALEAGADHVIVYTRDDFVSETRRLTEGAGVQVVYDSVGKTTFEGGLDVLAPRGMMVLFGQSSGAVEPLDPQLLNRKGALFLTRPSLAYYTASREELDWRAKELFSWVAAGTLDVRIGGRFGLEDALEAHRALESRQTTGKLLLRT